MLLSFPYLHESTFQNCRFALPVRYGHCQTSHDRQGATRFTCLIIPDMIRVDQANVWDWGLSQKPHKHMWLKSETTLTYKTKKCLANLQTNERTTHQSIVSQYPALKG
ncbi:hypothetical protein DPMN_061930 [Dreissena polymorpha]|uniref:Uncharacterized protein n=1 Tax=Dreissena polymorpha TaxID=45954 RepID=A0A9D4C8Q7_DREPO|nr:hypothetical protein DPMN_061930 [Dreissena polymorpha]